MIRRQWSPLPSGALVSPWLLFSRDARIVTLFGGIMSSTDVHVVAADSMPFLAEEIFGGLILLGEESKEPVRVVINSTGGSVPAGFTIIQAIEHLQAKGIPVEVLVIGASCSMASIVLATGTPGRRYAVRRSVIHLHSASKSVSGKEQDFEAIQQYSDRLVQEAYIILANKTKIAEFAMNRDEATREVLRANPDFLKDEKRRIKQTRSFLTTERYLSPDEALEAGIIDAILGPGDSRLDAVFALNKNGGGS